MAINPETHYTTSGDVHVAYQVFGEGSVDLVFVPGFISPTSSIIGMIQATLVGFGGSPTALLARADEVIE